MEGTYDNPENKKAKNKMKKEKKKKAKKEKERKNNPETLHSEERNTLSSKLTTSRRKDNNVETPGERVWTDLPVDIWRLVFYHLPPTDRRHLGQFLRSIPHMKPLSKDLLLESPCLILLAKDRMDCRLVNPVYNITYTVKTPSLHPGMEILYSREGWLLIRANRNSIFFFNPLTRATIDLPDSENWNIWNDFAFSFQSPPTSRDCVVVALNFDGGNYRIYFCHRGDEDWQEICDYDFDPSFNVNHTGLVFHEGLFYYSNNDGRLCTFNPVEKTLAMLNNSTPDGLKKSDLFFMESNGELLLVSVKATVQVEKIKDSVHVYKLNSSRNRWEVLTRLEDMELYVGRQTSTCLKISGGQRIYLQLIQDQKIAFYSYETHELRPRNNFKGTKAHQWSCWIQPNCLQPLPEDFQWSQI